MCDSVYMMIKGKWSIAGTINELEKLLNVNFSDTYLLEVAGIEPEDPEEFSLHVRRIRTHCFCAVDLEEILDDLELPYTHGIMEYTILNPKSLGKL